MNKRRSSSRRNDVFMDEYNGVDIPGLRFNESLLARKIVRIQIELKLEYTRDQDRGNIRDQTITTEARATLLIDNISAISQTRIFSLSTTKFENKKFDNGEKKKVT